ncbi:MAG: hypothetical protein GXP24_02900 [Planctomycetes bacterium]|nr:hypothetical protein [Planctomycetota bacterium]
MSNIWNFNDCLLANWPNFAGFLVHIDRAGGNDSSVEIDSDASKLPPATANGPTHAWLPL